ncbi:glycosyltransferase family 4 protein [Aquimarina rhabdastrellae]
MKNKAIIFLVNHMGVGGCQKVLFDLIEGLNDSSEEFELYLVSRSGVYSEKLIKREIKFIDRSGLKGIKMIKLINDISKKHEKIILHTNNRIDILYKFFLSKNSFHIHTFHSTFLNKNYFYYLLKPQKSISISNSVKRYLEKYRINSNLIYNGINIRESVYDCDEGLKNKILYVGRLSKEKGVDLFIKALNYRKDAKNKLVVDFYGEGNLFLERDIRETKQKNNILNFYGFHENPWHNVKDYDMIVIPSLYEGFCLVAVEAASMGIPIICNDIPTLREVVPFLPEECFFNVHEYGSILNSINYVIDNKINICEILSDEKEKIRCKFSKQAMVLNYKHLYKESFKLI